LVDDLEAAVGDCRLVIGCSARARSFPHAMLDPRQCGTQLVEETASGEPAAVIFGPERTGLANQDLDRCTYQVQIPANPEFSSLNLAAAVQIVCYEIFMAAGKPTFAQPIKPANRPSLHVEMEHFYDHLQRALDSRGFLDGEMREVTLVKLRRLFWRARPNSGELRILHTLMRFIHSSGD
jgi:tRNA (cytidine32/uridine32-2'-O)-methyltransferase